MLKNRIYNIEAADRKWATKRYKSVNKSITSFQKRAAHWQNLKSNIPLQERGALTTL